MILKMKNEIIHIQNLPDVTFMKVGENKFTIIDRKFENDILKHRWWYKTNGYVGCRLPNNGGECYLHRYIMLNCLGLQPNEGESVDHINWKKMDNRQSNLRFASQSLQNRNRDVCTDQRRVQPQPELQELGIDEYPKGVRYDPTEKRFVIDKHPQLTKEGKKTKSSTRKGTLLNKYYDICMKGHEMDKMQSDNVSSSAFITSFSHYLYTVELFNQETGNHDVFDKKLPQVRPTFESHAKLLEFHHKVTVNYTNEVDKNDIVYNADVKDADASMVLKQVMIPQHVTYNKAKPGRGSKFTYEQKYKGKKISKQLCSGKRDKTLKEKYDEMMVKHKEFVEGELIELKRTIDLQND